MSRILLKQLNIVERRSLSTLISNKRVLQQPVRSLSMSNTASANRRLTVTKNWLASSNQSRNVSTTLDSFKEPQSLTQRI